MARIVYNNKETELESGYQATMKCANKTMLSDVVFVAENPVAVTIVDTELNTESENAIANKVVAKAVEDLTNGLNEALAQIEALTAQLNALTIKIDDTEFTKENMTYSLSQTDARSSLGISVPEATEGQEVAIATKEYVDKIVEQLGDVESKDYGDLDG